MPENLKSLPRLKELEVFVARALSSRLRKLPMQPEILFVLGQRMEQFLADFGAVGLLLSKYQDEADVNDLALSYWDSRVEPEGLRLEDLVTALLVAFGTSYAAALLLQGSGKAYGALKEKFAPNGEDEILEALAALQVQRKQHLNDLLSLYREREETQKKLETNSDLYDLVAKEGIKSVRYTGELEEKSNRRFNEIKAILEGELDSSSRDFQRLALISNLAFEQCISVTALSPHSCVGELVVGIDAIGHSGRDTSIKMLLSGLKSRLRSKASLPNPMSGHSKLFEQVGSKVLVLDDQLFHWFGTNGMELLNVHVSGFIVLRGGFTSHCAVIARGLSKGCVHLSYFDPTVLIEGRQVAIVNNELRILI